MIKFFKQYKEWYNYHLEIEQKKHECDSQKLINLSNAFYQTRKNLMEMAEKYSNEKENLFEEPFLSAENFNSIMESLEKIDNELDEEV